MYVLSIILQTVETVLKLLWIAFKWTAKRKKINGEIFGEINLVYMRVKTLWNRKFPALCFKSTAE